MRAPCDLSLRFRGSQHVLANPAAPERKQERAVPMASRGVIRCPEKDGLLVDAYSPKSTIIV